MVATEKAVKTCKKLKGPKIAAVTQQDESNVEASIASVVTKLKGWKEFFDLEEFEHGVASMSKSKKQEAQRNTQLSEEDGGSDSEPSVDNFDAAQLEENLIHALDLQEGETNPFELAKLQQEEDESAKDLISDDIASLQSLKLETEDTKEGPKDYVVSDDQDSHKRSLSANYPTPVESEQPDPSQVSETPMPASNDNQRGRPNVGGRYVRLSNNARNSNISSQIEQERLRISKYPELANQLINQLILQNN